jgi:hypothetical protein
MDEKQKAFWMEWENTSVRKEDVAAALHEYLMAEGTYRKGAESLKPALSFELDVRQQTRKQALDLMFGANAAMTLEMIKQQPAILPPSGVVIGETRAELFSCLLWGFGEALTRKILQGTPERLASTFAAFDVAQGDMDQLLRRLKMSLAEWEYINGILAPEDDQKP